MDFGKIRNYLFLGLLLLVTTVFLWMLRPFALPIFWAGVLAVLFHPLYLRLQHVLKHHNLAAAITLALVTVIIIVPLSVLGTLLVRESLVLYAGINSHGDTISSSIQNTAEFLKNNVLNSKINLDEKFIVDKISEGAQTVINYAFVVASNLTQNFILFIGMFLLMLYTLFFFLRDGEKLLKKVMHLCPLGDHYELLLYNKFTSTAAATIKGTILLGMMQGFLGGAVFAITGINGAIIWAIIMSFLSIVPGVGASIVWLPAAALMLLTGHTWQGILILVTGFLVISTADNLLRPVLVGKNIQMHPFIILFSTLGGVTVFGISGFVLGPVLASLFLAFWEMYEQYYHNELDNN